MLLISFTPAQSHSLFIYTDYSYLNQAASCPRPLYLFGQLMPAELI
jgi:hypothetical protein